MISFQLSWDTSTISKYLWVLSRIENANHGSVGSKGADLMETKLSIVCIKIDNAYIRSHWRKFVLHFEYSIFLFNYRMCFLDCSYNQLTEVIGNTRWLATINHPFLSIFIRLRIPVHTKTHHLQSKFRSICITRLIESSRTKTKFSTNFHYFHLKL